MVWSAVYANMMLAGRQVYCAFIKGPLNPNSGDGGFVGAV